MSSIALLKIYCIEIHFFEKNVKRLIFPLKLNSDRIYLFYTFYRGN